MGIFSQKIADFIQPADARRREARGKMLELRALSDGRSEHLKAKRDALADEIYRLVRKAMKRSSWKARFGSTGFLIQVRNKHKLLKGARQVGNVEIGEVTIDVGDGRMAVKHPGGTGKEYSLDAADKALKALCDAIREMPYGRKTKGLF